MRASSADLTYKSLMPLLRLERRIDGIGQDLPALTIVKAFGRLYFVFRSLEQILWMIDWLLVKDFSTKFEVRSLGVGGMLRLLRTYD